VTRLRGPFQTFPIDFGGSGERFECPHLTDSPHVLKLIFGVTGHGELPCCDWPRKMTASEVYRVHLSFWIVMERSDWSKNYDSIPQPTPSLVHAGCFPVRSSQFSGVPQKTVNAGQNRNQRMGIHRDRNGQSDQPHVFKWVSEFWLLGQRRASALSAGQAARTTVSKMAQAAGFSSVPRAASKMTSSAARTF